MLLETSKYFHFSFFLSIHLTILNILNTEITNKILFWFPLLLKYTQYFKQQLPIQIMQYFNISFEEFCIMDS